MNKLFLCAFACILISSVLAQVQPPQPEAGPTLTLSSVIRDQAPSYMKHSAFPASWWKYNGWEDHPTRGDCGTANDGKGWDNTDFELPMWMYATDRRDGGSGQLTDGDRGFLGDLCTKNNINTCGKLGPDNTPVYRTSRSNGRSTNNTVQSAESFSHWFHDTYKTKQVPYNFVLNRVGESRVYNIKDNSFFPIDGRGWNDRGWTGSVYHNFAFCVALHASFYYQGGEVFNFTGDDDMFVYIDRKLVIDLGGVHEQHNAQISLDNLDIWKKGSLLDFDMFYCERHTTASNIQITTSLGLLCADYDGCGVCGGNGQSCCNQDNCRNQFDGSRCFNYRCAQNNSAICTRTPKTCPEINKCTINTCNAQTGECESRRRTDCDKGDRCFTYGCSDLTGCTASPKICETSNKCLNSKCDSRDGQCKETPKPDLNCEEGNSLCNIRYCNTTTGSCETIDKIDSCTDRKCFTTSCNAANGNCAYTPVTCDDGDRCTTDRCNPANGQCVFTPITCSSNDCTNSTCNPATGQCQNVTLTCANGGQCQSGSCRIRDKCSTPRSTCNPNGTCEYIEKNCGSSNPCLLGRCNMTDGSCYTTPALNGTCLPCNGRACQQSNDPCNPVVCTADGCVVQPVVCEAIDACSTSRCVVSASGRASCENTPVVCSADTAADSCTPVVCDSKLGCVNSTSTCNDYNPCTVDTCTDNCTSVVPENVCDDNNVCTVDSCNSAANTTILSEACEHSNITCAPPENACLVALPCHPVNGCLYEDRVCPQPADFCQVPYCDRNAGCLSVPRGCVVEDPDCYVGVCDTVKGACTQRERSNFATITSDKNGGKTCMFVYKRKTVAAITGGAAAGIAIGGAVALGLIGYGGKKGYDLWTAHQNTMSSGVSENPLYTPSENAGDNPLYGTDA